ncbi:nitrogenase component 1 [Anaerocolumna sp.]|uniref:nitrogenase component 1 n=1 Tax=Anaerocolumna sp. TaxID=2041569 RepID=UPI0028B02B5F|nr:nitrogenase component 1 [Anaerocolumna sp.]
MEMIQWKHLNRLSEVNSNQGIKFLHRAAAPGSHCPMHTALAALLRIEGVSSLVVGMAECGYYSRYVMNTPYGKQGELHYVYELDSNEVVFGCREGVKKAIKLMDKEGAKIIMMIITCIPALIGEDAKAIITELEEEITAKVLYVDAAHFKRNGYMSGYYQTLVQLADVLNDNSEKPEKTINLLGPSDSEELIMLKDIISKNHIAINEIDGNLSIEKLNKVTGGTINIVLTNKMLKYAKRIKEKFGIPFICLHDIYDVDEISAAYEKIFKALEIPSEIRYNKEFNAYKNEVISLIEQYKPAFENISYICASAELDVLPMSVYLSTLGIKPILLHIEEFDEDSIPWRDKLTARGMDPYVTYITDKSRNVDFDMEASMADKDILSFGYYKGLKSVSIISDKDINAMISLNGYQRTMLLLKLIIQCINQKQY